MARTYHVSNSKCFFGQVAMFTQLGYAAGMLFLALRLQSGVCRKRLILLCLALATVSLLLTAASPNVNLLIIASFFVGIFSLIPQLLVPMTAHLAKPERTRK